MTKIGWNSPHWFFWDMAFTKFSGYCLLWPWPLIFWPQILITTSTAYEPKYVCDQNWVKFPSLVCRIWCSHCFRYAQAHSLRHSLRRTGVDRPDYCSSAAVFQRWWSRPLSRIFQKIRLAEPYFRLISGLAEFLRKLRNSAENTTEHHKFGQQDRQIETIKFKI